MVKAKKPTKVDETLVPEVEVTKGPARPFYNTSTASQVSRSLGKLDYIYLAIIAVLSNYVRFSALQTPDSVVFDEVHFGKFAKHYINGRFFMDVHPPLAKMLFGAVGIMGGFKGDFSFSKIGDQYPITVPYVLMRTFPAILGLGTVFFSYLTLRSSGCRPLVCFFTSFLLVIENLNVTISRYILLDSPLMFFIAAAVYAFKKFEVQKPFSYTWYKSLIATGLALGLALSSKWVGLFTVAWAGVGCIIHMWFLVGDLKVSSCTVWKHAFARAGVLLGLPIALYLLFFSIHFQLLVNDGEESASMTPAFRSTLKGNKIPESTEARVGFGSIVSIRHLETQGGYLHSHNHMYPTGSKQQQITLYPHLDSNNNWLIEPYNDTIPETFVPITDGTKVRLKHVNSGKRLHSHDEKPPVSERDWQKEVSGYGYEGFKGDSNDDWVVEIVQKRTKDADSKKNVKAITSIIRFKHAMTGNYLFAGSAKLPEWGFAQSEITAAGQGYRPLTYFYIETNGNSRLNDTETVSYPKMGFFGKFIESHIKMWKVNQGLTSHHPWQSNPLEWPFLVRGINYWSKDNKQVYLLGNAAIWWTATTTLFTFAIYAVSQVLKWQTGATVGDEKNVFSFNLHAFSYFIGWLLHYFPFYIMGRQLFLHHYLPSLYFGVLALGQTTELLIAYWGKKSAVFKQAIYLSIVGLSVLSALFYANFSPLIYGSPWTKGQCEKTKALSGWDYDCNNFHKDLSEYKNKPKDDFTKDAKEMPAPSIGEDKKEAAATPNIAVAPKKAPEPQSDKPEPKAEAKKQPEEQVVPPAAVDIDETVKAAQKAEPVVQEVPVEPVAAAE